MHSDTHRSLAAGCWISFSFVFLGEIREHTEPLLFMIDLCKPRRPPHKGGVYNNKTINVSRARHAVMTVQSKQSCLFTGEFLNSSGFVSGLLSNNPEVLIVSLIFTVESNSTGFASGLLPNNSEVIASRLFCLEVIQRLLKSRFYSRDSERIYSSLGVNRAGQDTNHEFWDFFVLLKINIFSEQFGQKVSLWFSFLFFADRLTLIWTHLFEFYLCELRFSLFCERFSLICERFGQKVSFWCSYLFLADRLTLIWTDLFEFVFVAVNKRERAGSLLKFTIPLFTSFSILNVKIAGRNLKNTNRSRKKSKSRTNRERICKKESEIEICNLGQRRENLFCLRLLWDLTRFCLYIYRKFEVVVVFFVVSTELKVDSFKKFLLFLTFTIVMFVATMRLESFVVSFLAFITTLVTRYTLLSMLLDVSLCFSILLHVYLCLPMSPYVSLCFSMSLYVSLCLTMFLNIPLCFPILLYVSPCFSMPLYASLCFLMLLYTPQDFSMLLYVSLCLCLLLIFVVAVVTMVFVVVAIIVSVVAFITMLAIVMSTITLLVLIALLFLLALIVFSVAITTYLICLGLFSSLYLCSKFEVVIVVVVFIVSTGLEVDKSLNKLENFVGSFLAFMSALAMFAVTIFVVVVIIMIAIVMTIITLPVLIVPSCFLALIVPSVTITIYSDPATESFYNCYFSFFVWRPYYCPYLWFSCVFSYSDSFSNLNCKPILFLLSLREKEKRDEFDLGTLKKHGTMLRVVLQRKCSSFLHRTNKCLEYSEKLLFPQKAKNKCYDNYFAVPMSGKIVIAPQNIVCFTVHTEQKYEDGLPLNSKGDICKLLENLELKDDQLETLLTKLHKKILQTREGKEQILWQDCKCRKNCILWELYCNYKLHKNKNKGTKNKANKNTGATVFNLQAYELILRKIENRKRRKGPNLRNFLGRMISRYVDMLENNIKASFGERIDWKEVHRLMRKKSEALIIYKKYLRQQWLKQSINQDSIPLIEMPENGTSVVYLIYSTKTSKYYIGETQNMKKRIETEMRNAFRSARFNYEYKNAQFERIMGRIGVQTWCYRILANLGELKYNAKNIRLNYEKQYVCKLKNQN